MQKLLYNIQCNRKTAKTFFLFQFLTVLFINVLFGQKMAFTTLSVENGLSQNSVLAIAQDSRGFIWAGTRDGLNKYDTRSFTVYKNKTGNLHTLSNNYILSLLGDSYGNLWAGTLHGLNRYDPVADNFERIDSFSEDTVSVIYEDSKQRLWIGTENGLFLLQNRDHRQFRHFFYAHSPQTATGFKIHSIFEDHKGILWVGTATGLLRVNIENDAYDYDLFKHELNKPKTLSGDYITSIVEDAQQRLWIGTQYNGLQLFNATDTTFQHFVHIDDDPASLVNNNIRKLILDKSGQIWTGTQDGLSIMNPTDKTFTSYQHDPEDRSSLSQNSIHSIFKDKNGTMWIGTYFGGADIAYSNAFTLYQNNRSPKSISNNVISSMVEDRHHNFWIGTEGGGLNYLYRQSGYFISYKNVPADTTSLPSNLVKAVYIDKKNNVWVGVHGGGLCLFDSARNRFKQFVNVQQHNKNAVDYSEIITMLEDSHGRLWVGSLNGLTYIDNKLGYFEKHTKPAPFNLPSNDVHYLLEDTQKNLWIGTSSGLFKLADSAKQPVAFVEKANSGTAAQPFVNCILQDSKGRIWIGTEFGGIGLCDTATKHITYFTEKDGLANNNVLGILEAPNGDLWISTNNGLSRFNIHKKSFKTYTSGDGLAGNQFNYNAFLKDSYGKFFFGGYNGISSFYPGRIESNDYISPMVFTGLKLFNQPIAVNGPDGLLKKDISQTQQILLHYDQNVFSIDFALLNFIKNSKNRYAYKLDKFDKDWNETAIPSAAYTNLLPGTYTFWVKGANNDGVWSEPISLKVEILPPYWRTWWAYCIYVLLLIGFVFLISRFFFLRALLRREDDLHQVKLNFFTNISHEIRTHLTLIMAPVDKLLDEKKQDDFARQQLGNVKINANRLLKLVGELMDFRKAETNHLQLNVDRYNLVEFLENIYTSFRDLSLSKKINISFVHNTDNALLYFDAEQLEKVFFNLLTNAFKFTPGGGNISIMLEERVDTTVVSIVDNGRGIAPEYQDKLFSNFFQVIDHGKQNTGYGIGLALTKHIVELHHGFITVDSEPATDTREGKTAFTVVLMQGYQHFEGDKNVTIHAIGDNFGRTETFLQPILPSAEMPLDIELLNSPAKPFTVLVTEDNADLRRLVSETLSPAYNILLAENGLEGWQRATEQIPDLIISDVMMPEMNGFALCKKLKTDERTSHIPVILLTAKSSQNDQVSGLETGADIYLTKPFSTKILELNVRNLLASRERMRQRFSQQIGIAPIVINETETVEEQEDTTLVEQTYVNPIDQEFLDKLIQVVEENIDNPEFGVTLLSKKVAMSPPVLYKKLKAVTDMSVNDFVKSLRFKKAALLLRQKEFTEYDVAAAVGYYDRKYFNKEFKRLFGVSPKEYAEG